MLTGVEQTSIQTITLIENIKRLMIHIKNRLRSDLPKIYSQDLLNNIFRHPYTKTEFLSLKLNITRQTAAKYLKELVNVGLLEKYQIGKENFYLNRPLYDLLLHANTGAEHT